MLKIDQKHSSHTFSGEFFYLKIESKISRKPKNRLSTKTFKIAIVLSTFVLCTVLLYCFEKYNVLCTCTLYSTKKTDCTVYFVLLR